jgi:hypothetical protein
MPRYSPPPAHRESPPSRPSLQGYARNDHDAAAADTSPNQFRIRVLAVKTAEFNSLCNR